MQAVAFCAITVRLAFLSHLDVRSIGCFKEDTLLAIKAPYGSTLDVPDPDEVWHRALILC